MTNDLVTWLRQQLDDDERVALASGGRTEQGQWRAPGDPWGGRVEDAHGNVVVYDEGSPTEDEAEHIARHDPAWVLAEVDAKRRILDFLSPADAPPGEGRFVAECTLKLLALPYADRPGYRPEWRP